MAETKKTTTAKTTAAKTAAKKPAAKATTTKTAVKTTTKAAPKAVKETETVKEVAKKPAKKAEKQIKVTLVKSTIGYNKKQSRVVKALGLKKLNSSHVLPDNACVRGMVKVVSHLVKVEELN